MDNASKALIIAGAILIAVMLVSLGVMLYNTAAGVAEQQAGSIDALGIQGFNGQFTQFMGKNKNKASVKGLLEKIRSNNAVNDTEVAVEYKDGTTTENTVGGALNKVEANKTNVRYTVSGDFDTVGLISKVKITKQ